MRRKGEAEGKQVDGREYIGLAMNQTNCIWNFMSWYQVYDGGYTYIRAYFVGFFLRYSLVGDCYMGGGFRHLLDRAFRIVASARSFDS